MVSRQQSEIDETVRHIAEIQGIVYDEKHPEKYNELQWSYEAFQRMWEYKWATDKVIRVTDSVVIEPADMSKV